MTEHSTSTCFNTLPGEVKLLFLNDLPKPLALNLLRHLQACIQEEEEEEEEEEEGAEQKGCCDHPPSQAIT